MRNTDFSMQLKRAECPVKVAEIVDKTIRAVYLGGLGVPEVSGGIYCCVFPGGKYVFETGIPDKNL